MKRLKGCFLWCLALGALGAFLVWWLFPKQITLPQPARDYLKKSIEDKFHVKIDAGNIVLAPDRGKAMVASLGVAIPGRTIFFRADRVTAGFASGTGWSDIVSGDVAFEDLAVSGAKIDLRSPWSEFGSASGASDGLAAVPLKRFNFDNLEVQTAFGRFQARKIIGNIRRLAGFADIFIDIASNPIGGSVIASGSLSLRESPSEISFSIRSLPASMIPGILWLDFVYGVHVASGVIDADLTWKGTLPSPQDPADLDWKTALRKNLTGNINLRGLEIGYKGTTWQALISATKEGIDNARWSAKVGQASGTIDCSGAWDSSKSFPGRLGFQLKVAHFQPVLEWFPSLLETQKILVQPGTVDLDCRGRFDGENLETDGKAFLNGWSIEEKLLEKFDLAWNQRGHSLLGSFTSVLCGADLNGTCSISRTAGGEYAGEVDGKLSSLDLETLRHHHNGTFAGICNGLFHLKFPADQGKVAYEADIKISNPRILHIASTYLSSHVSGTGGKWELLNPSTVFANGGMIGLKGKITPKGIFGDAFCERIDLAPLGLSKDLASGTVSFKGRISGTLQNPVVQGNTWAENYCIFSQSFDSLKAGLEIRNGLVVFDPITAKAEGNGDIDGYLSYDLERGRLFSAKVGLNEVPIARFRKFLPLAYAAVPLAGLLSGTVDFGPTDSSRGWDFNISARKLSVGSETVDSAQIEGSILDNQGELRRILIEAFGGTLEGQGRFLGRDAFVGSLRANRISIESVNSLRPFLPQAKGELNLDGNLNWSPTDKTGHFSLFGKDLWVKDRELGNLGAEVTVEPGRIHVKQATFDRLGVSFSGDLQFDKRRTYRGKLSLEKTDLSFIPAAHGFPTFKPGDLLVNGVCSLSGDLASWTPDVVDAKFDAIEARRGNDLILANRPIEILFQNGIFEIRALDLRFRKGVIGIEGTYDPAGKMALTVNGDEFSLEALSRLFELTSWNVDGQLSLKAGIIGSFRSPQISGAVTVKALTIDNRLIPEIQAKCALTPENLKIERLVVTLPHNRIDAGGTIPLPLETSGREMDLRVTIASGSIQDLPNLLPEVFSQATGSISSSFRLTGNPLHPAVAGDFLLTGEALGFRGMRTPLKNVTVTVQTKDGVVEIGPVQAKQGRGLLNGGGSLDFRSGLGSMTAFLEGKDLDFSWGGLEAKGVSISAGSTGNLYNPIVRCKIKLPRGKARASGNLFSWSPKGIPLPFQTLDYKLDVEIPRNFWIRNSFLNAELRGKFSVSGTLLDTHFDGAVQCVQGWLYFQRRKFQLESGELKFGSREGVLDPHIYLKSVTNIQNTQVFLVLEGRVSSFTPRLYSSPPMSEGDLFALLTLGRNLQEAKQSDPRQLFEKEILEGLKNTYLSGLLGSTISTALNLDELFLGSLFDRSTGITRSFLRIGKYIGHNFFFAYEGTLSNEGRKSYIIEYRLPRGFKINLEFEKPINSTRVGVSYDWNF